AECDPAVVTRPFTHEGGLEAVLARARGGEPALNQTRCTLAGRQAWLEARYFPWRDETGQVAGVIGLHTDVTERRRRAMFVRAVEAVGQSLASSLDLNEVLDTIVEKALEVMGAESALVVSWDGAASSFTVMRAAGRLSGED